MNPEILIIADVPSDLRKMVARVLPEPSGIGADKSGVIRFKLNHTIAAAQLRRVQ